MNRTSIAKSMLRSVELFLKKNLVLDKPVLLGFSGGHDSRALFEILDIACKRHGLTMLIAHVDHGWREESYQEALALKKMAEDRGFAFFLHRLEKPKKGGNLEDRCREERYAYFDKVYRENDCQALVLGHQADDQAETVLKRLFEGAHFTSLGAMQPLTSWKGMAIWRPLLEFSREEVLEFLREKQIDALDDRTNYDTAFLRSRMRAGLFPVLEEVFGKGIRSNILEFARSFHDLRAYFLEKTSPYFKNLTRNSDGVTVDFSYLESLPAIELEAALKLFFQKEGLVLGTRHLKQIAGHLVSGALNKRLLVHKRLLIADRKRLFISNENQA